MKLQNVGIVFGSRSVEHEVSIITAHQIMAALDRSKLKPIPIYITKNGKWMHRRSFYNLETFRNTMAPAFWLGRKTVNLNEEFTVSTPVFGLLRKRVKIDVAIPATHGTYGEDGTVQAYLELLNVPYVGAGSLSSALCMNKPMTKRIFRDRNLPILDFIEVDRFAYRTRPEDVMESILRQFSMPVFVKPAVAGSSIGVSKACTRTDLEDSLDLAFTYCSEALVEPAVPFPIELNCSVIGNRELRVSAIEKPLTQEGDFLSYEAKYLRGRKKMSGMQSMTREVPAKISETIADQIRDLSIKAFRACLCSGIARIDFLMNGKTNEVFVNEINTLPGSFSYYLWEPAGLSFPDLLDELIMLAIEKHKDKQKTKYTDDQNLLEKLGSSPKLKGKTN